MKRYHKKYVNVESFKRDVFSSLRDFGPVLLFLSMTGKKMDKYKFTGSKLCITEVSELGHISYTSQLISLEF